ncbi:MAG: hypothetical protein IT536_16560 [Hyphomicrobiales bacterium]|nr:hypothetical protein [Hyphomicrobiales bacterium]
MAGFLADFFAVERRAWRGEEPLGKVFWGYGVLASTAIAALYVVAHYTDQIAMQQILLPCFAAYTVWILVSVWRCAAHAREAFWGLMARLLTVVWAANTVMVLGFLQLDLLARYWRG